MNIQFSLEPQVAVGLINFLGKMSVDTGVAPLRELLIMQYNAQVEPPKETPTDVEPTPTTAAPAAKPSRARKKS